MCGRRVQTYRIEVDSSRLEGLPPLRHMLMIAVVSCAMIAGPSRATEEPTERERAFFEPHAIARDSGEKLALSIGDEVLVLGEVEKATFFVQSSIPDSERPLRASVNVGEIGEIERIEPGLYGFEYRLPETRFPQVAVLAIWRDQGPDSPVSFFRVPLPGTARLPVRTRPGTTIDVTVGGEQFGPFSVGRDGRAEARVIVPPGVDHATVTAVGTGRAAQRIALGSPSFNRMTMAVLPASVTADGVSHARLHVHYDVTGRRVRQASELRLTASRGEIGRAEHREGPLFEAVFRAPVGTAEGDVEIGAAMRGDPLALATATIEVTRQRIRRLEITSTRATIVADGRARLEFLVQAKDDIDLVVAGRKIDFSLHPDDRVERADMTETGRGGYHLSVVPGRLDPPESRVELRVEFSAEDVEASTSVELIPWAPSELRIEPRHLNLPADGRSAGVFNIRAFDTDDRPLDHLVPTAHASFGLIERVEQTSERGYFIRYRSPAWEYQERPRGRTEPPVREETIRIEVAGMETEATVRLTAGVARPWLAKGYLEIGGGYRTTGERLAGAQAALHAGAYFVNRPRLLLGAGLWTGVSDQRGDWEVVLGGAGGRLSAQVLTVPVMASLGGSIPLGVWSVGADAGAGLMFVPGTIRRQGEVDVSVDGVVHAFGARVFLGRKLGIGRLIVDVSIIEATQRRQAGELDVAGQLGGASASIGYRIDR